MNKWPTKWMNDDTMIVLPIVNKRKHFLKKEIIKGIND